MIISPHEHRTAARFARMRPRGSSAFLMADLGPVRRIEAQATGQPGQREFRLWVIGAHQEFARLKLEKEHLFGLRMAIHRVLSGAAAPAAASHPPPDAFPAAPGYDFVVGRLGVAFSES